MTNLTKYRHSISGESVEVSKEVIHVINRSMEPFTILEKLYYLVSVRINSESGTTGEYGTWT